MKMESFYQEMCDFQEENEEMVRLYETFYQTNIYNEIINFLDIAHPEWRKNKELGESAPEFILHIIAMCEDQEYESSTVEWLTSLYEEIASEYERSKSFNQSTRDTSLIKEFISERAIEEDDFYIEDKYQKQYEKFKLKDNEEVYWPF